MRRNTLGSVILISAITAACGASSAMRFLGTTRIDEEFKKDKRQWQHQKERQTGQT
jgi:hypothetical protein